jgi:hypothetical protein
MRVLLGIIIGAPVVIGVLAWWLTRPPNPPDGTHYQVKMPHD